MTTKISIEDIVVCTNLAQSLRPGYTMEELVQGAAEQIVATVNSEGLSWQVQFLLRVYGSDKTKQILCARAEDCMDLLLVRQTYG